MPLRGKEQLNKSVSKYRTSIMGISMLSIMLFHQNITSVVPFNFFHIFGYWGVDAFLFLSGMGLVRSIESNSLPVFYKHRFFRIVPCCIFCGLLKYLSYKFFFLHSPILRDGLHIGWLTITGLDLWFIPTIIILYLISPFLYRLLIKNTYLTVIFILLVFFYSGFVMSPEVGFNWFSPIGILVWTIARVPVFATGILFGIKKSVFTGRQIFISTVFFFIAIFLKLMIRFELLGDWWHTYVLFFLAFGLPALLAIIILFVERIPEALNKGIDFFGSHSLELYLVHEYVFKAFEISMNNNWKFFSLLVSFSFSILTAHLCKIGLEKLKAYFHNKVNTFLV